MMNSAHRYSTNQELTQDSDPDKDNLHVLIFDEEVLHEGDEARGKIEKLLLLLW